MILIFLIASPIIPVAAFFIAVPHKKLAQPSTLSDPNFRCCKDKR